MNKYMVKGNDEVAMCYRLETPNGVEVEKCVATFSILKLGKSMAHILAHECANVLNHQEVMKERDDD